MGLQWPHAQHRRVLCEERRRKGARLDLKWNTARTSHGKIITDNLFFPLLSCLLRVIPEERWHEVGRRLWVLLLLVIADPVEDHFSIVTGLLLPAGYHNST